MKFIFSLGAQNLPVVGWSWQIWVVLTAMTFYELDLETQFSNVEDGGKTSFLAELLIYAEGRHVCRTAIYSQVFQIDAVLDPNYPTFAMLDTEIQKWEGRYWVSVKPDTALIAHKPGDDEAFTKIIEVCSGIGAVGQGFKKAGVSTVLYNNWNETFCKWLAIKHADVPIVQGDLFENNTIAKIADAIQGRSMLSGGFSCQPFSGLGDRKQEKDSRSRSLPGLLRLGYFLRCPVIIAECTKEVKQSEWAQALLKVFCDRTGYVINQQILDLHGLWPSTRTRWWACIALPYLGVTSIPPLPELPFRPCIADLFQLQSSLPPNELRQLRLDKYEARHFHSAKGGIGSSMVNRNRHMPTATDAWGTQLTHCHCGCRQSGFDLKRLEQRGLYGILVPLDRMMDAPNDHMFDLRHPHPQEVAILNGLDPRYVSEDPCFSLRFELGAVGQLASPIQSSWVMSNVLQQIHSHTKIGVEITPKYVLADLCLELIESRFLVWENQFVNEYNVRFMNEFLKMTPHGQVMSFWSGETESTESTQTKDHQGTGHRPPQASDTTTAPSSDRTSSPSLHPVGFLPHTSFALPPEQCTAVGSLSHPTSSEAGHAHEGSVFPGSALRVLPDGTFENGTHMNGSDFQPSTTHAQFRPNDEVSSEFPGLALGVLHDAETWKVDDTSNKVNLPPNAAELIESPSLAMSSKFPGPALGVLHGEDKKRNAEHFTEAANPAKRIHCAEFAIPPEPYGLSGGLNLFANKQHCDSKDVPNQPLAPVAEECAPISPAENPMPAGSPEPTIEPTAEWTCPPFEPDELDIQIALRCETDEELLVWIGLEHEELYAVNCPLGTTIGQLTQAEANIGCSDHLKAISAVGSELLVSSEVHNCQIVFFRLVKDHQGERCPLYRIEAGFPKLNHLQRTKALWHQQGWVAFDEMTFYINSINRASNALTTEPLHLHDDPRDQSTIGNWILTAFQTAIDKNTDLTIGTACLWRHHWFPILAQFDGDQMNVTTSSEAGRYVTELLEKAFDSAPPTVIAPIQQRVVPTTWAADCGFQTLAFILKIVHGDHQLLPVPIQEAIEWRVLFAQHLRNYFRHNDMMDSPLGGAPDFARFHDLRNLLEEHGVDKNRSHGVAQHLVQTLGSAALQTILSAPRPWKDLKTRATQHKIQIVTSDELNRQIEKRQKEDKPFGKKATKSTTNKHKPSLQQELVLKADQIKLPEGIWQQSDGTKLA